MIFIRFYWIVFFKWKVNYLEKFDLLSLDNCVCSVTVVVALSHSNRNLEKANSSNCSIQTVLFTFCSSHLSQKNDLDDSKTKSRKAFTFCGSPRLRAIDRFRKIARERPQVLKPKRSDLSSEKKAEHSAGELYTASVSRDIVRVVKTRSRSSHSSSQKVAWSTKSKKSFLELQQRHHLLLLKILSSLSLPLISVPFFFVLFLALWKTLLITYHSNHHLLNTSFVYQPLSLSLFLLPPIYNTHFRPTENASIGQLFFNLFILIYCLVFQLIKFKTRCSTPFHSPG